ncbi:MAG: sugar-binding protein, partial [Phycisphaeraceae bacterium JB051]
PVMRWLAIREPLELVTSKLFVQNGKLTQHVKLHNHAQQSITANVRLLLDQKLQNDQQLTLAGSQIQDLVLPLSLQSNASPTRTWNTRLIIDGPTIEPIEQVQSFNLLAAHEVGTTTQGKFNNQAAWSGKGASGQTDQAIANFQWQDEGLIVDVAIKDDVFDQRITDGVIWKQDSIQLSFDTHPDLKEIYEPLAGIFTKKLSRLAFALTPNGELAWRHETHNEEQLATGDFTQQVEMKIKRDESAGVTHYHLMIPWLQIGLDNVKPGKSIGVSILVNDSDGPATRRAMYELFSGLTTRLPQNNGRLTLQ